jgi:hypothetical protein
VDEYGEPEAAELTAAAEPLLPARQIVAKECNSANATVPPQIASGAQDQDHSVTLEQAGTNSLPVSVDLSAAASAAQEQCARVANQYNLDPEETKELILLLREMKAIGFTHSNQLSKYIMEKRLASKYPNISGIVRMELDGRQWDFRGGFPPQIYAIVCRELGLDNQRSRAVPVDFTSYKELSASPASGQRQMMGKPAQRDTPPKSNHRATTRLQLR